MPTERAHKLINFLIRREKETGEKAGVKYKYIKMSCPVEKVLNKLNIVYKEIENTDVFKNLKIQRLDVEKNGEDLIYTFNRSLLTGTDPYQPINWEDLEKFPKDTTFIGYLYGRPVGFITYTIEEEDGERIGVIAGLGVIPEYRRRGVAKSLILKTAEKIKGDLDVKKLVCDVYEKNVASYNLIKKFGFEEEGSFYI
ncbi:MAG: GNAT family N-acetyltransferase [Candidatus Njordarchaeia archaeon]